MLLVVALVAALIFLVGYAFDVVSVERQRALPGFIVAMFSWVSDLGKSAWELYPAGVLVLILLCGRWSVVPRRVRVFWAEFGAQTAFLFASIGGAGIIVNVIKQPIGRGRPVTFDAFGAFSHEPFRFVYEFQSFPSGHSATAGALIAFGFLVLRRWRVELLIFGLAIAASRVLVGAHYPSDILAGLLLGYGFSIWLAHFFARHGWAFSITPAGTIRARAAGIRWGSSSPGRMALVLAGLADALVGRPVWLLELKPIGDLPHGGQDADREREIDDSVR